MLIIHTITEEQIEAEVEGVIERLMNQYQSRGEVLRASSCVPRDATEMKNYVAKNLKDLAQFARGLKDSEDAEGMCWVLADLVWNRPWEKSKNVKWKVWSKTVMGFVIGTALARVRFLKGLEISGTEVAALAGVSHNAVNYHTKRGQIDARRVGNKYMYSPENVAAVIEKYATWQANHSLRPQVIPHPKISIRIEAAPFYEVEGNACDFDADFTEYKGRAVFTVKGAECEAIASRVTDALEYRSIAYDKTVTDERGEIIETCYHRPDEIDANRALLTVKCGTDAKERFLQKIETVIRSGGTSSRRYQDVLDIVAEACFMGASLECYATEC